MKFNSKLFRKVTHVIFDLDGTILDTETLYREALQRIADIHDKECNNDVILKIAGMTQPMIAETIIEDFDLPVDVTSFLRQYNGFIDTRIGHCDLMPGVEKLIKHLYRHRIPIALGTSSSAKAVDIKTKNYRKLFDLMSHSVCGESDPSVKIGKPAPDIFMVAAARFSTKPQAHECLVFEDSINGAKAARAAGMQVVLVAEPHLPTDIDHCATLRLNSMLEFEPELFGLPSMIEKNNIYY